MSLPEKENTTEAPDKVVYSAKAHTIDGRENGPLRGRNGGLDIEFSLPSSARIGTNPEQLLAAGWSACFESSIGISALKRKMPRPEVEIGAEVDLNLANGEYFISARFSVSLPGLDRDIAKSLIQGAEKMCTYCKATRGNVDIVLNPV